MPNASNIISWNKNETHRVKSLERNEICLASFPNRIRLFKSPFQSPIFTPSEVFWRVEIMSTPISTQGTPFTYSTPPATSNTTAAQPAAESSSAPATAQPPTRQTAEETRNDRTLAEFLLMLDDYEPLVGYARV